MNPDRRTAIIPATDYARQLRAQFPSVTPASQPALGPGFPDLPGFDDTPRPLSGGPLARRRGLGHHEFKDGCYLARFLPGGSPDPIRWPPAVGTLRVEVLPNARLILSGDLYRCQASPDELLPPHSPPGEPENAQQPGPLPIPSFPRSLYHAYIRFDDRPGALPPAAPAARAGGGGLGLLCQCHRIQSIEFNAWQPAESIVLTPALPLPPVEGQPDPPAHPAGPAFLVADQMGTPLGTLTLEWISPFFREAVVEIDTEAGIDAPLTNGAEDSWEEAFARVGWNVRTETGRIEPATPPSGAWTLSELHDALLQSRDGRDLDLEWRYHVSVVRRFDMDGGPLGIAFDHEALDHNDVPREGVAIQADARLPREPVYGRYAGGRIRDFPELIFHIGVHEIGHAMGLYHNHAGVGVLRQVSEIAGDAGGRPLEAEDLVAEFAPDDIFRLRHLPDIYVRPGGTPWETQGLTEDRDDAHRKTAGLHLPRPRPGRAGPWSLGLGTVAPTAPFGAPLRVDFELRNSGRNTLSAPAWLSLSTPFVRGWVVAPDGEEHEFRSLFKPFSADGVVRLAAGEELAGSMTLLRGGRGALFRRPGRYSLWVQIEWQHGGQVWRAVERTKVQVAPAESRAHDRAARDLIRTPETLGYLVMGRSNLFRPAERAVDQALDTPELGPHFAFIKARASARHHFMRSADWVEVQRQLAPDPSLTVLNRREREHALQLRKTADQNLATR